MKKQAVRTTFGIALVAAAKGGFGRVSKRWGSEWKAFIRENAGRSAPAYIQTNTLPYKDTWADLEQ